MRRAGLRSLLFWSLAVAMIGAGAGCDNPFDPLSQSDKIQGLAFFDYSATQEKWDSDPEYDGLEISMSYYNEFRDSLSFHDKPHKIQIEIWSQKELAGPPVSTVRDKLLATKTVDFSNSDDLIRIPIEYYIGALSIPDPPVAITGFLLVRLFPPQEYPQKELTLLQDSAPLYTPLATPQ